MFLHDAKANQAVTLLIKLKTQGTIVLPLLTSSVEHYAAQRAQEQLIYGAYFGVSLAMLIYNLLLFIYLRDRSYFYYCAFVSTIFFYSLAYTGFGFQWLWPEFPVLNKIALPFSVALGFLTSTLFAQNFLQLKHRAKWVKHTFQGCIGLSALSVIYTLLSDYSNGIMFASIVQFFLSAVFLITAVYLWIKGVKEAKYFTIAWAAFIIGTTLNASRVMGLVPSNTFTIYAHLYGTVIEMLLLSMGLAYRFEVLRGESHQLSKELSSAEDQATSHIERYRELFNNSPAGLFHYWRASGMLDINKYAISLLPDDLDLARFIRKQLNFKQYRELFREGQLTDVTLALKNNTWYNLTISVIRDKQHKIQEIKGTILDITANKQSEQLALRVEHEKLNSLTQLIIGISHQFNTPLGVIVTAQDVTNNAIENLQKNIAQEQPSLLNINKSISMMKESMNLSCRNSERLLIAMRELKSAIGDQSELVLNQLQPKAMLTQLFQSMKPRNKVVNLHVDCPNETYLNSDTSTFLDIFTRLFTNSFEHGFAHKDNGEITIAIHAHHQYLKFHFQDNGRGLTSAERQNIFVPFYTGNTRHQGQFRLRHVYCT